MLAAGAALAGLSGCAAWGEPFLTRDSQDESQSSSADAIVAPPLLKSPHSSQTSAENRLVALPPVEPHDGQPYGSNSGDASTVISLAAEDSLVTQVQFAAPLADQEEPRTLQLVPADAETADSVSPAEVPAEEELTFQPSSDPPAEEVQAEEVQAEEVQAEEVQAIPDAVPIDLGIALQLTSGQNPQVAFAQAQINEAYAQLQAAQVLWLPSIRFGASYNKHEGRIQDVAGNVFETSRIGGYAGLGIRGIGSGSPSFPGIAMHFKLSDAIYDPRIASRRTRARQSAASAVVNDELLESALAYINLLEALQVQAVAAQTVEHSEDLARVTADFARAGQGTQGDADRAAASRAVQRNRLIRAQSDIVIASARLSQQLSLDPGLLVMPQEPVLAPIDLSNADLPLPELVATGLTNRPELSASRLLVAEAAQRLRREVHSPWLPSLYLGMDYGGMGGGLGNEISNSSERL